MEREQTTFQSLANANVRVDWLTVLAWLVLPATLGLAITHQSLWMDEGFTVWFAAHRSVSSFFSTLTGLPGARGDPQMILYLTYIWGWVKLFGESEVALRAANIPFAILFMGTMSWACRRFLRQPNLWALFCLSPFFWFYLNEARPYIALMAFSAVAIVALLAYLIDPAEYRASAPWWCLIALLLAWGTHILGAFLFPSIAVLSVTATARDLNVRRNFLRDWSRPFLFCMPAFLALGTFYVWASAHGVSKEHGEPGLSNLAFILYEFLGFGGLGPPRFELRQNPHLYVFAPYWPLLLLGAVSLLTVGLLLFRARPPKLVWRLTTSLIVGMAIALGFARIENFRIIGRHMAVFFPLLLLTLMLGQKRSFSSSRERYAAITALVAVGIVWGISDARLVYMRKYEKDAYREASSIAVARARQDGGKIMWVADPHAAHYYGIQVMKGDRSPQIEPGDTLDWHVSVQAIDGKNWDPEEAEAYLDSSTASTILVFSRGDLFDTKSAWSTLIQQQKPTQIAQLPAFSIYEWQPKVATAAGIASLGPHRAIAH
jgi:hypothetical protein